MNGFTKFGVCAVLMGGIAGVSGMAGSVSAAPRSPVSSRIQDYVPTKLEDFSATMRVVSFNEREGSKINKDFGYIYKIKGDIQVRYKEENKLRIDGNLGATKATMINNGSRQVVRLGGIKDNRDLGPSPGKRKTLLDVGLISGGYLAYTEAEFKGTRPVDGVLCAIFRVSYRDKNLDTSFRMVWVDPKTKITVKREEYTQEGKLNATFLYKKPKEVAPGIWFPSVIEAYNSEGGKAGVTSYGNVHVNAGLGDDVFK